MVKVSPTFIEGKKIVRLSDLPSSQSILLSGWLSDTGVMRITLGDAVHEDCVDYEDYEYWLNTYVVYREAFESDI